MHLMQDDSFKKISDAIFVNCRIKFCFAVTVLVIVFTALLQAQPREITVDIKKKYQTIDNFGASDCWSMQKIGEWVEPQKNQIADLLFSQEKGIGLSAWRFNIGAGINRTTIRHEWRTVETFEISEGVYDWTRQAEERWFFKRLKQEVSISLLPL